MSTKLRILFVIIGAPFLLAPNCKQGADGTGDQQLCQDAIDYLENDCAIASSAGAGTCGVEDQCVAQCILDASCDGLDNTDDTASESYNNCADGCFGASGAGGSGGDASPDCSPCGEFLTGLATYDEVCPSGQQLLDEWSACICTGPCEVACFEHCQGFDPNLVCSECISTSCATQTEACQSDT